MPVLPEQSLARSVGIFNITVCPCSPQALLAALQCKFILLEKLD